MKGVRRSRLEIALDLLSYYREELSESQIMLRAGVSYENLNSITDAMFHAGLVSKEIDTEHGGKPRIIYSPTAKGYKALMQYERLLRLMPKKLD